MKRLLCAGVLMIGWALGGISVQANSGTAAMKTAYDFSFEGIDGVAAPLSAYKGKVLLVVNTASECGFTPQYEGLEKLYNTYKDRGLVVVGVPSNDFGGQEPGNNAQIKQFCESRYRITFPMMGKAVVKGKDAYPFYAWAKESLDGSGTPSWNFHKYLIGRDGKIVEYYSSITGPASSSLAKAIEGQL